MKLYNIIPAHTKAFVLVKESLSKSDRAILKEAGIASDADLENLIKGIAKDLAKKDLTDKAPEDVSLDAVEDSTKQKNEDALNEGLVLTLILASPTLIKLLGKLIDWAYSKLALSADEKKELEQYKKDYAAAVKAGDKEKIHDLHDKVHASKVGKALGKFAHMAHEAFVWPIKKLLQGVAFLNGNSWLKENAQQAAELIYAVIMIGVAGHGIVHSLEGVSGLSSALTKLGTNMEALSHLTVDALKGGDMTAEVLKFIFGKILKA
jgi:hypothetical protein